MRRDQLDFDLIVPVPLHHTRFRTRGYNQAELLARAISKELGVPLDRQGLKRHRRTAQQAGISDPEERRRNVEGAFSCLPAWFKGRSVLLVDDVMTTGATMAACAQALKEGACQSVLGCGFGRSD